MDFHPQTVGRVLVDLSDTRWLADTVKGFTTVGGFFLKVPVFSLVLELNRSSILKQCYLSAMLTQASRKKPDIRDLCFSISARLS